LSFFLGISGPVSERFALVRPLVYPIAALSVKVCWDRDLYYCIFKWLCDSAQILNSCLQCSLGDSSCMLFLVVCGRWYHPYWRL